MAAGKLGVARGFLQILKEENRLYKLASNDKSVAKRKRNRSGKDREVEEGIVKWFDFARSHHVPVNGPIIRQEAEDLAKKIGHVNFKDTEGWMVLSLQGMPSSFAIFMARLHQRI